MPDAKNRRKEIREWGIMLGILALLYFTGWGGVLLGYVQQGLILTGIYNVSPSEESQSDRAQSPSIPILPFQDADGVPLSTAKWKGKVVLINFWASWCPPCRAELPGFQRLYRRFQDHESIVIVMVSLDDKVKSATGFSKEAGYSWPVWFPSGPLPEQLQGAQIPRTYLLDHKGRIRLAHTGIGRFDHAGFLETLETMAAEARNQPKINS